MLYYLGFSILINVLCSFDGNLCNKDVRNVVPKDYTLTIKPYFNNMTFEGDISIKFSILNATKQISLRAEKIKQKKISLKPSYSSEALEINVGFMETNESWLLFTIEDLVGNYTLNVSFEGRLSSTKEEEGWFYGVYIDDEAIKMYVASESLAGTSSRLFPSLERKFSKTPFTASIARNPIYSTLSSMQLQEPYNSEVTKEEKLWDTFYDPNISTNHVGFMIHTLNNVTTSNYTVLAKSEAIDQTNMTLSMLVSLTQLVQSWFPAETIAKLNIVALPDVGPQMISYPGLVFYREDRILFKKGVSNTKHLMKLEESVVHTVVGQLLMKLDSEESVFFQGLATYMEQKLLTQIDPSRQNSENLYTEELNDNILESNNDSTNSLHKKVAGLLRMIVDNLSKEQMVVKVLNQFLNESAPVTSKHFFSIIDQLSNESHNLPSHYSYLTIMQPWILQSGCPIVTVTTNETAIFNKQISSTKSNAIWPIPLSCKCGTVHEDNMTHFHQLWLTESSLEVTVNISCDWILCNNQNGLYKVNYDSIGWRKLSERLIVNHTSIPAEHRSILINDIFYLAEQSLVNYTDVFYLTQYLINETDHLPWQTAALHFEKYIKLFSGTPLALNIQDYVKDLYSPYFDKVYRIKSLNESRVERLATTNALFWGCHWRLQSCITFTSELFKQWKSVSSGFPPDYKQAALCTGVEQFPEVFLEAFDAFTQSVVEGDRLVFLRALACTRETSNINFLLELVFLDKSQMVLEHNGKLNLIKYLLGHPEKVGVVIRFLEKNYDTAVTVVGLKGVSSLWNAVERNIIAQEDVILIRNIAKNVSLPLSLRERLSSILVACGTTQRKSIELAPLVTIGLSQHWTMTSSCVQPSYCFHAAYLLLISFYLQVCFLF